MAGRRHRSDTSFVARLPVDVVTSSGKQEDLGMRPSVGVGRFLRYELFGATATLVLASSAYGEVVRFATWPAPGKNAGIIFAQSSGLFEERGLESIVLEGYQNTLVVLSAGEAEIAQVLCSSAVSAIGEGLRGRIIAARDQRNPIATVSLPRTNIERVSDFRGLSWGHSPGFSPERAILERLVSEANLEIEEVDFVNVDFPARLPSLLSGEIDFFSAWIGSGYPVVASAAAKVGQDLDVLRWEDFGVDIYGECYVARTDASGRVPSWVPQWLEAAREGHIYAIENPQEVGAVVLGALRDPIDPQVFWQSVSEANELLVGEGGMSTVLLIDDDKMRRTVEWSGGALDYVDSALWDGLRP